MSAIADSPLDRVADEVATVVTLLRPRFGRLSIDTVAERLEVSVGEAMLPEPIKGVAVGTDRIVLSATRSGSERALTFGHEIAHVLLARGSFRRVRASEHELFADQFGRELVLPRGWLTAHCNGVSLAARLNLSYAVVALQLAAVGHAPAILRHHRLVLCATCGARQHRLRCVCIPYRRRACAGARLPRLDELASFRRPVSYQQMTLPLDNRPLNPRRAVKCG